MFSGQVGMWCSGVWKASITIYKNFEEVSQCKWLQVCTCKSCSWSESLQDQNAVRSCAILRSENPSNVCENIAWNLLKKIFQSLGCLLLQHECRIETGFEGSLMVINHLFGQFIVFHHYTPFLFGYLCGYYKQHILFVNRKCCNAIYFIPILKLLNNIIITIIYIYC